MADRSREDRVAAMAALLSAPTEADKHWAETGQIRSAFGSPNMLHALTQVSRAIAKARAEGFAAGREAERRTRVAVPLPAMPTSIDAMRTSAVHYIRSRGEVGATTADLYAGWVCALVDLVKALEGGGSNG